MIVCVNQEEILQAVRQYVESRIKIGTHEELTVKMMDEGAYAEATVAPKRHDLQE